MSATIRDVAQLRALLGEPSALVPLKIHRELNAQAREFIARSPMLFLATADRQGRATVSPKGDAPGFVHVADAHTLFLPERKGNKLIFSLQNVLQNPHVGLIFLLPGSGETLRVQGDAELLADADLCQRLSTRGRPALLAMKVQVSECYFHCAKAFIRSDLWNAKAWPEPMTISFGEEIADGGGLALESIPEFDAGVRSRYQTEL